MTVLVETRHPGEFILSEANGQRSREAIIIASGAGIIAAGTVLGKVTATGKYIASAVGASDGSQGDPPPLKWSDLKYVLWHQGGSEHAKEEAHA